MEDNDEWKRVSDADCFEFLLRAIPDRLQQINTQLKDKLLSPEEQSIEVVKASEKKQKVQEEIDEEKAKRKKLKEEIETLEDQN